jgi:hypothetical protein
LKFDARIARANAWRAGTRLLAVNAYSPKAQGIARDLELGPKQMGNWGNFRPLTCGTPAAQEGPPSVASPGPARPAPERRPMRPVARFAWKALTVTVACLLMAWAGGSYVGEMNDGVFTVIAWIGILFFGLIGLFYGTSFYKTLFPSRK